VPAQVAGLVHDVDRAVGGEPAELVLAELARPPELARRFASTLALTLLGLSVGANALAHGLDAYRLAPAWWVVVAVSAIAPAVLGAVVHLAVLVGRLVDPPVAEDDPAPSR